MVVGWDILGSLLQPRLLHNGIRFKESFKPCTRVTRLNVVEEATSDLLKPFQLAFANDYTEFLQRGANPSWKNPKFYIHLPFKKNEDLNPIESSHSGQICYLQNKNASAYYLKILLSLLFHNVLVNHFM